MKYKKGQELYLKSLGFICTVEKVNGEYYTLKIHDPGTKYDSFRLIHYSYIDDSFTKMTDADYIYELDINLFMHLSNWENIEQNKMVNTLIKYY